MKQFVFFIFLIIYGLTAQSQIDTATLHKNISAASDSMISIFKRQDWKRYADYMNPVLLEMTGGKEQFVQLIEQQMQSLKEAEIQVVKVGKIMQVLKFKDQYQSIVESFMQMNLNGQVVSGSTYDIGVSTDGINWTFFRITEQAALKDITGLLPNLSPDLKLPKSQMVFGKTLEQFLAAYTVQYIN